MQQFKEDLLHFIWKSGALLRNSLFLTTGESLNVIRTGVHNRDAGPDFYNSRIQINETTWAGNTEIHIRSSDWLLHRHHLDQAYRNVILHVVYHHDAEIRDEHGALIPTLEMKALLPPVLLRRYAYLQKSDHVIPCDALFRVPPQAEWVSWLDRLLVTRLERKAEDFVVLLNTCGKDWEYAFYVYLARSFGMKTNALPFEWLAKMIPLRLVAKHKTNLFQLRALFFGVAGLIRDAYVPDSDKLLTEFTYLKDLYALSALDTSIWKYSRTRPANFPHVRIEQFVALLHHAAHVFSAVTEAATIQEMKAVFRGAGPMPCMSDQAINLLLINSVLPVVFQYGKAMMNPDLQERALQCYGALNAEKNHIIAYWESKGIHVASAADSQALIELRTSCCDRQKCLECTVGRHILLNEKDD